MYLVFSFGSGVASWGGGLYCLQLVCNGRSLWIGVSGVDTDFGLVGSFCFV